MRTAQESTTWLKAITLGVSVLLPTHRIRQMNPCFRSMRSISLFFLFWSILSRALPVTYAQSVSGPSFEDVLSLRSVGNPMISPNGNDVAFTIRTVDWKENEYDTEIWLAPDGEEPFQLTRTADGSSSSPRWSPDGKWIAFAATRGEKQQIFVIRPNGGEAQAITDTEEGVGSFRWSPDGSRIAFSMSDPESAEMKDRKEQFGDFEEEDAEYRQNHLWMIDVQTDMWPAPQEVRCVDEDDDENCTSLPEPTRLTEGDFSVGGFRWSPDGSMIAFERNESSLLLSFMSTELSLLTLDSKEITPLVTGPNIYSQPTWSPDSKSILYFASQDDSTALFYSNDQIYSMPVNGGPSKRLAASLDEDIANVRWTPNGIFLLAREKTKRHLYRVNPSTGGISKLAAGPDRIWSVNFSADGSKMALTGQTDTTLAEVYKGLFNTSEPTRITDLSSQITGWETGLSEVVSWDSYDGTTIEGVLHKPKDFDLDNQHPLLVIIHGGPTGVDTPSAVLGYVYPVTQWLAKGALVLRPNYRGSAGYGEAFRSLNVRNLGIGDAWDVLSGVDYLIDTGIVDTTRMGAMGWSQGGYISAFLTTNTDRFNAISVGAGISNWMTYYVNTDIHPFTRQYLKGTPWSDPEIYALTSPMTTINDAKTPTLIQHGEFDKRVPIPNAYELYQGLQDVGVETKLLVYKKFGHGISRPKERLAAVWHNWQWFAKHVWGEDVTLPSNPDEEE